MWSGKQGLDLRFYEGASSLSDTVMRVEGERMRKLSEFKWSKN